MVPENSYRLEEQISHYCTGNQKIPWIRCDEITAFPWYIRCCVPNNTQAKTAAEHANTKSMHACYCLGSHVRACAKAEQQCVFCLLAMANRVLWMRFLQPLHAMFSYKSSSSDIVWQRNQRSKTKRFDSVHCIYSSKSTASGNIYLYCTIWFRLISNTEHFGMQPPGESDMYAARKFFCLEFSKYNLGP